MKQAKKNSFEMLPSTCSPGRPLLRMCYIYLAGIKHAAKNINSLLARRMPVWLESFLQFSFSNIVFMF